jgi:hypothetical protein
VKKLVCPIYRIESRSSPKRMGGLLSRRLG